MFFNGMGREVFGFYDNPAILTGVLASRHGSSDRRYPGRLFAFLALTLDQTDWYWGIRSEQRLFERVSK